VQFEFDDTVLRAFMRVGTARPINLVGRAHIFATIRDRRLREAVTPTHVTGCKRMMVSNDYYPALSKPTSPWCRTGCARSDPGRSSPTTAASTRWTRSSGPPGSTPATRRSCPSSSGATVAAWRGLGRQPEGLHGTSAAGFPNAFMMWGPNAGTGCNFVMVEAQLNYTVAVLRTMRDVGRRAWTSGRGGRCVEDEMRTRWPLDLGQGRLQELVPGPDRRHPRHLRRTMRSYLARSRMSPGRAVPRDHR